MMFDILTQALGKVHTQSDEGNAEAEFGQGGQIGRRFRPSEGHYKVTFQDFQRL
jgi:hypothetical protein